MALADLFTDISDAIREKDGTADPIVANDFPARIRDIETGYRIDLSVEPPDGGTVSGGGRASAGMNVTVTVADDDVENGHIFSAWQENGVDVSKARSYSFSVENHRSLTAIIKTYNLWFSKASGGSISNFASVTYGGGKFIAIASGTDQAAYSTDGITWTATTFPLSGFPLSVTYGDGKFVAIASRSSYAAYSTDGITWTKTTTGSRLGYGCVVYGDGKFVAVDYAGTKSIYSTDGITWTISYLPFSTRWTSVAYGNGKFVAIASGTDRAAYSEDGITWGKIVMPSSGEWSSITYGDGKFVAVADEDTHTVYSKERDQTV